MRSGIKRFRGVLGCAALAALALAGAAAWSHAAEQARGNVISMRSDLANRDRDIRWPQGFDPSQADLFSHNELLIDASCARIWSHIIDATKWPEWYPNSKEVKIASDTVLKDGTVFRWTTFGLPIESKVNEFAPYTRIGWYGYTPGTPPSFYHTWHLKTRGDACLAVTDEVGNGEDAVHLRETDQGLMHRGHDLWLASLKWISEGK
jgi:Polyketide cyclase / dehydrase and lipid transport